MKEKKIVFGIIQVACNNVGVSRTIYYTAKKNLENGQPLTYKQSEVLKEIDKLKKEVYQP